MRWLTPPTRRSVLKPQATDDKDCSAQEHSLPAWSILMSLLQHRYI